jgi:hypothetical protein
MCDPTQVDLRVCARMVEKLLKKKEELGRSNHGKELRRRSLAPSLGNAAKADIEVKAREFCYRRFARVKPGVPRTPCVPVVYG